MTRRTSTDSATATPPACPLSPACSPTAPCGLRLLGFAIREDASQLLGLLQVVIDGALDHETRQSAHEALKAGERLYGRYADLFELALTGIACVGDEPMESIDIGDMVAKVTKQVFTAASPDRRPTVVNSAVSGSGEVVVRRRRLERGLHLLLDTAVAATARGVIRISIQTERVATRSTVSILVENTGLWCPSGTAPQDVAAPSSYSVVGTFVSRVLLHSLGASVSFEPGWPTGTTVRVTLAASPPEDGAGPRAPGAARTPCLASDTGGHSPEDR